VKKRKSERSKQKQGEDLKLARLEKRVMAINQTISDLRASQILTSEVMHRKITC